MTCSKGVKGYRTNTRLSESQEARFDELRRLHDTCTLTVARNFLIALAMRSEIPYAIVGMNEIGTSVSLAWKRTCGNHIVICFNRKDDFHEIVLFVGMDDAQKFYEDNLYVLHSRIEKLLSLVLLHAKITS